MASRGGRGDQAEVLRRMLGRDAARMVTFVSACAGVGKTSMVINLAAALAAQNLRVLVIDENHGSANVCNLLDLPASPTSAPFPSSERSADDLLIAMMPGVAVLPAAGVAPASLACAERARATLFAGFRNLQARFDVTLIDAACNRQAGMEALTGAAHDTIVVSTPSARSVTASYALIKRLNQTGERRFHMLLNRVQFEDDASIVLRNMAMATRRFLRLPLASLGSLMMDEGLRTHAGPFCPVIHTHPASRLASRLHEIADAIVTWPGTRAAAGRDEAVDPYERIMQRVCTDSAPVFAFAGV